MNPAQSSAPMEPRLEEILKGLSDQMAQTQLTLTNINTRLDHLEAQTPRRTHEDHIELEPEPDVVGPRHPRGTPRHDHYQEAYPREARPHPDRTRGPNPREVHHDYHPRRPNHDPVDRDDQIFRNIKLDAPTFDGSLNPKNYIDWEG